MYKVVVSIQSLCGVYPLPEASDSILIAKCLLRTGSHTPTMEVRSTVRDITVRCEDAGCSTTMRDVAGRCGTLWAGRMNPTAEAAATLAVAEATVVAAAVETAEPVVVVTAERLAGAVALLAGAAVFASSVIALPVDQCGWVGDWFG